MQAFTVDQAWAALGYKVRPIGDLLAVVTDEPMRKVGSLFLPMKASSFYGDLPHLVLVRSTVLSVGSRVAGLSSGDRVVFPRTYFVRVAQIAPDVMVGLVRQPHVVGRFTERDAEVALLPEGKGSHDAVRALE